MVSKFFIVGGYKGMKEKYGKRVSPHFDTYGEALHYQQCNRVFSESICKGEIKYEKTRPTQMAKENR